MKELILDLRNIDYPNIPEAWADSNEKNAIENAMLDHIGKIVRVKITVVRKYKGELKNGESLLRYHYGIQRRFRLMVL